MEPSEELWREIPKFRGYEASTHGRIRDWNWHPAVNWHKLGTKKAIYYGYKPLDEPRIVKQQRGSWQWMATVVVNGRIQRWRVAWLVAEAWLGPRPSKDHRTVPLDRDHLSHRPENLKWVRWKRRKGERVRVKRKSEKITGEDVRKIRSMLAEGVPAVKLAAVYNLQGSMISKIRYGKKWPNAGGPIQKIREKKPSNLTEQVKKIKSQDKERPDKRAKLRADQVTEIRERLARGERKNELAKAFGVCPATISAIWSGKKWKDAKGPTKDNCDEIPVEVEAKNKGVVQEEIQAEPIEPSQATPDFAPSPERLDAEKEILKSNHDHNNYEEEFNQED